MAMTLPAVLNPAADAGAGISGARAGRAGLPVPKPPEEVVRRAAPPVPAPPPPLPAQAPPPLPAQAPPPLPAQAPPLPAYPHPHSTEADLASRAPATVRPTPPAHRTPNVPERRQPRRPVRRRPEQRERRARPEDPRQRAVFDALVINEGVLDEAWFSSNVDVMRVIASIAAGALDAYEDDPAGFADWVAMHRTGQCDCH